MGEPKDDLIPVCLACWRNKFSMTQDPPRKPGWPEERCSICGRRTNHGIYVDGWSRWMALASEELTKGRLA